jgi:ParB/RepB/Spo0J family partition protein
VIWHKESPFEDSVQLEGLYDLVIMNPPLRIKWANEIGSEWIESGATSSEYRFLELALRALKPGGQLMVIAPYNYIDRLPKGKGVKAWFENFATVEAEFGKLPGEFRFTKIQAFGFLIQRIIYPVENRKPLPADGELPYVPDDYAPPEEPFTDLDDMGISEEELEQTEILDEADFEEHLPEEADMEAEADDYEPEEEIPETDVERFDREAEDEAKYDEAIAEAKKERDLTKEEVEGSAEPEQTLEDDTQRLNREMKEEALFDEALKASKENAEQLEISFLPDTPPEPVYEGEINARELAKDLGNFTYGKPPDAAFLRSIETWGIRDPIILTQDGLNPMRLRDGKRRLKAALKLEIEFISVRVYNIQDISGAALTLDSNAQRSSNPIAEYEAIAEFMEEAKAQGVTVSESDISQATGMKVQTIRKRMKLSQLPAKIVEAVQEKKVALGVAEGMVSLTDIQKANLLTKLEDKGKITGADVHEVKQVKQKETIEGIPNEVFDLPEFDPEHQHQFKLRRVANMGFCCSCGRVINQEEAINILNVYLD